MAEHPIVRHDTLEHRVRYNRLSIIFALGNISIDDFFSHRLITRLPAEGRRRCLTLSADDQVL